MMRQAAGLQLYIHEPDRRAAFPREAILPLALYAALASVLDGLFAVPAEPAALLAGAAALCVCVLLPARFARPVRLALCAGALLSLLLIPLAGAGAALLVNRLYAASEAVNAYAYTYFSVPAVDEAAAIRAALLAAAVLGGALSSAAQRVRAVPFALFAAVAALSAYFGVTAAPLRALALFAVLTLLLARSGTNAGNMAALLAGLAAVSLAVFLIAPRPNAAVEAYSEYLRDELGRSAQSLMQSAAPQREADRAHQESRQSEIAASEDAAQQAPRQDFERLTEAERELSLPQRFDWLRTTLLLLAMIAVLTVPFLPFLLIVRVKRRTDARRDAFSTADNAAAIRAMFQHTVDWLRAAGLRTENRPYAQCAPAVAELTSGAYGERYAAAAAIWREAAYSEHAMTDEQRAAVRELLDATAATLYEKADRRTRFRMKYVDCLCGS